MLKQEEGTFRCAPAEFPGDFHWENVPRRTCAFGKLRVILLLFDVHAKSSLCGQVQPITERGFGPNLWQIMVTTISSLTLPCASGRVRPAYQLPPGSGRLPVHFDSEHSRRSLCIPRTKSLHRTAR